MNHSAQIVNKQKPNPYVCEGSEYVTKVGHNTINKFTFESFVGLEFF